MKIKPRLRKANQIRQQNVFERTERRLTLGFSGQLMLFLFLFAVMMFFIFDVVIMHFQERELQSTVHQEAELIEKFIMQMNQENHPEQDIVLAGVDQFFYYVIGPDGEVRSGKEKFPQLHDKILSMIQNLDGNNENIVQRKLTISEKDLQFKGRGDGDHVVDHELQLTPSQTEVHLMIAKKQIMFKGQLIGTLYVGKDISYLFQLLRWLIIILVALTIVFLGVAFYFSNRMSKKAMIPINKAFDRQREFVADASHELRTPLSVIQSSIDAIEMTMDVKKDGFVNKLLFNMKDEVKRMTHLIGDLLTLARSDSGKIERQNEVFDIIPVAKKVVDAVQTLAIRKNIQLDFQVPGSIIGQADRERITQLLYILLDNAIKYTESGGVVKLSITSKHHELSIKVADTGIGIKQEELPLIFERFYRSDKARSRQMGSYGLGLSIAKWIVDIHNGSIQVESALGKGSTFIVKMPFFNTEEEKA